MEEQVVTPQEPTEIVENNQLNPDVNLEGVDNPKSYKHFQALAEKRLQETQKERETRIRLEERLQLLEQQLKPKVENEVKIPEKPQKPMRPVNYDPTEAVTDINSASAKYDRALQEYLENIAEYNAAVLEFKTKSFEEKIKRIDEFENQTKEQEKYNRKKAETLAEFQKHGTPQEAEEAFNLMSSPDSLKPEFLMGYYKYIKSQKSQPGINQVQQRNNLQQIPPPPTGGGITQDDNKNFVKSTDRSSLYKIVRK